MDSTFHTTPHISSSAFPQNPVFLFLSFYDCQITLVIGGLGATATAAAVRLIRPIPQPHPIMLVHFCACVQTFADYPATAKIKTAMQGFVAKIRTAKISSGASGSISAKVCTRRNFPLYKFKVSFSHALYRPFGIALVPQSAPVQLAATKSVHVMYLRDI